MNESYLNSGRNTVLLSKPSKAICLLLMVLFFCSRPLVSFGQTNTWNGSTDRNTNPPTSLSLKSTPQTSSNLVSKTSTLATVIPNKVDETCPESNNGSISPVLSNGLSNIRYIKLTQQYAEVLQIEEIQAFEIFTGTNVALSSNGATATASSFYSNAGTFGPLRAIDGDYLNYSFWHSNIGIGDYIIIDLASAKNIDFLRIYNRRDCCQEREQNMLLELFDASNNVVYSKTVNLYEGVNGPHHIDVNVLGISWSDGATTLNRTGLDSGTYTLNYANAGGYTSAPINISSVNPASVGGTISGGSTPICIGSSTGTLTLSGQVGTVVQWEKQLNGGGWSYAGGSATTFSEILYESGTWEYRALVQSGGCASAYSSVRTIVVSSNPVAGGIYTGNTPICINSSTGAMNLTKYTGTVLRWEKRHNSGSWITIANTTATYTESPSIGGTWEYRAVVGNGSCTEVYSSAFSVIVNPALTISLTSANTTVCQNMTIATLAYSATTGSPNHWQIDFDATAETAGMIDQNNGLGVAPGTIAVNVPWSIAAGVYNGNLTVITFYPSCSSVNYPITVTVDGPLATPTVTLTQPTCTVSTGTITINTPAPATGITYTVTGTSPVVAAVTNDTGVFSGLLSGIYDVTTTKSCGTSAVTSVTLAVVKKTWGGSSWSPVGNPTADENIEFTGNYSVATDITACSCTVISGNVTIPTGNYLKLRGKLTVNAPGTLTFEDTSSLVQTAFTGANSGNITYKRKISSPFITDYTYWSSPVVSQNLDLSPFYVSGMYYSYDNFASPEDWKEETATTTMQIGKGYIIRGTQTMLPLGFYFATFYGVPNNGPQSITVCGGGKSNLIGNPYPSAIDADAFLTENSAAIDGTLYFWTHNSPLKDRNLIDLDPYTGITTAGSGALAYTSNDYAVYNFTGGVVVDGVTYVKGGTIARTGGTIPTGKIAAGQSFFTTSTAMGGPVNFTNAMRIDGSGNALNNSNFFKTKNHPKAIEKNRVWLNLINQQGAFKQTLVGYVTDATNDYDTRFDGDTFDGNEFVDFYSINQDKNLTIQGRALPFDEKDEVPLGFRSAIDGDFIINIDRADGLLSNQPMFLEDKLTKTVFDLKNGNYIFKTTAGTFNDRFVLKYNSKTLGVDVMDKPDGISVIYSKNTLIIYNKEMESTVNSVSLYTMAGQKVAVWDIKDSEQSNIQISVKDRSLGIYIAKVKTTKGEICKKIIVN
jgi:hypothetical protein